MNETKEMPVSVLKHGMITMVASAVATVAAGLAVTASISMNEGPMTAWMCIATFIAFRYIVRAVRAGRVTRDVVVITLAADAVVLLGVLNLGVGRVAITALLIHYVLYYYRTYLANFIVKNYAK